MTCPTGEETYTYSNGDVYVGGFNNNMRSGRGTLNVREWREIRRRVCRR